MRKRLKFKILLFTICSFGFFFSHSWHVLATQFYIISADSELRVDQSREAELWIDTQNEYINAVEGKLVYPADKLKITDIEDGSSVVNFWVEKPKATAGQVSFSGIIPGGYMGKGILFKLSFSTIADGPATMEIRNAGALLNDGLGTPAKLDNISYTLNISETASSSEVIEVKIRDTEAPEKFSPILTKIPEIAGDKYLLIFYAQDKGSGIDHYEVDEGWWGFKKVESPYILQHQKLDRQITVKAVDKFGNVRLEKIEPLYPAPWYEKVWIFVIILVTLAFIIVFILGRALWLKSKHK